MSFFNKQIISEKTLVIWFVCSVLSGLVIGLIFGAFIYLIYGCFPLRGSLSESGECLSHLPHFGLIFLPCVLGCVVGVVWTRKINK